MEGSTSSSLIDQVVPRSTERKRAYAAIADISETTKRIAFEIIKQINSEKIYENHIVTEVKKATPFYIAEEHINYYSQNSNQAYCSYTITPKINKLKTYFNNYIDIKNE